MSNSDTGILSRPVLPYSDKYPAFSGYKETVKAYNSYMAVLRFKESMLREQKKTVFARPFLSLTKGI